MWKAILKIVVLVLDTTVKVLAIVEKPKRPRGSGH